MAAIDAALSTALSELRESTDMRKVDHEKDKPKPTRLLKGKFEPRNLNQAILHTALIDPEIKIAFAVGLAGGGKTYVPLRVAFEHVADPSSPIKKVYVFRPHVTTSGQKLGAVPGDLNDKTAPYTQAIDGNIEKLTGQKTANLTSQDKLTMSTADTSRGGTLDDAFIIIDEAQNFSKSEIAMLSTRIGENSKMVFTGDISSQQNDLSFKEGGLVSAIACFVSAAKTDPVLDQATAFVKFTAEDAAARAGILPSILRAFEQTPEGFIQLADHAIGERQEKYHADLAHNRKIAMSLLQEGAEATAAIYEPKALKKWRSPELRAPSNQP